ncbi:AbrB family transcriptional regulator [Propylenella binzhouense]|uniref:AbrB family transcriptional regulator n=1 Tax=Propylenella binzhouense TaxID=2555902 RepID=UPI0031B5E73B
MLVAFSAVLVVALESLHLPAALLLGPMAAAIAMAAAGGTLRLPPPAFVAAQGIVGLMIADNLPASIFGEILGSWPIFLAGTLSTVVAASGLGWLMSRGRMLPGTTAIWGSSPGAAAVMTLMSESYGADMRLVAIMQYLRVVCCAVIATLVARLAGGHAGASGAQMDWLPDLPWLPVLATFALAQACAWLGQRLRIPGGALIVPLAIGLAVKTTDLMPIVLPPWLLALSYALIGWGIGTRFTPELVAHAGRILPRVLAFSLALIALCGVFAMGLVFVADIDPLTAYLATSPGGADSVAIIAASTGVDISFVMAMQIARFLFVLLAGPAIARLLSRSTSAAA